MLHLKLLASELVPIAAAILGGTLLTIAVTGWLAQFLRRERRVKAEPRP